MTRPDHPFADLRPTAWHRVKALWLHACDEFGPLRMFLEAYFGTLFLLLFGAGAWAAAIMFGEPLS